MVQPQVNGSIDVHELPPESVIFGHSVAMASTRKKFELAAAIDVPVLLQGDSGTGKEILAKLLHARSTRARFAWVKVICPAIPNTLIESELFGYERGAFTGANSPKRGRVELAHRGTLFLDEVGSLDLSVQAKLLQFLQDGSFMRVGDQEMRRIDARFVSSSNIDLKGLVDSGGYRLDLFYRVNALTIDLPPLRQRIDDLPDLIDYFLELYSRTFHRKPRPLTSHIVRAMRRFDWPGNIRQLENMIRGYVLIGDEDLLAADLVAKAVEDPIPEIDLARPVSLKKITRSATEKLERQIILKVLEANGGSRRRTAEWLNMSYRSLLYKLGEAQSAGYPAPKRRGPAEPVPQVLGTGKS